MILHKINIDTLLEKLQLLKTKGYKYLDLEISDEVSDPSKYSQNLTLYPLERDKEKIKKPRKKLKIEELIKYES